MKVLFLPNYSKNNPYQSLLAAGLARHNVFVTIPKKTNAGSIIDAVRACDTPDIIHLHWVSPYMIENSLAKSLVKTFRFMEDLWAAKQRGIKLVWTVHNLFEHARRHPKLETVANQFLVRMYDQIIVHCNASREAIFQTYRFSTKLQQKINVLPHGNYIGVYENLISQEEARKMLGLKENEFCFLFFGGIKQYKGVYNLVDAFRLLAEQIPNIRLLIAGKPAWDLTNSSVESYCAQDPRIQTHLRFIPNQEVQVFLNAADVVVLPYQNIMASGTVILAMSFGKPVITPRLGCIPEVLNDGWGIYNSPNKEDLFQMMKQALQIDLHTIGSHNLKLAKALNWEIIAQGTCNVYQKCLKETKQP